MVTDSMVTGSLGVPERLPTDSMALITSRPRTTLPNSEYWAAGRHRRGRSR